MGRNQAQRHRAVRSFVKGAPVRRPPRRPRTGRVSPKRSVPRRAARGRTAVGAGEMARRRRLFHALAASVAAQLVAVFAGSGALVAVFTLLGLLLCAAVIHS